jgi:hypothetical protein
MKNGQNAMFGHQEPITLMQMKYIFALYVKTVISVIDEKVFVIDGLMELLRMMLIQNVYLALQELIAMKVILNALIVRREKIEKDAINAM